MVLRYWLEGLYVEMSPAQLFSEGKPRRRRGAQGQVQRVEQFQPRIMLAATAVIVDSSIVVDSRRCSSGSG